jgi:multiple sugar transport system permease protein
MAGYAFARYAFRGRNALRFSVLFVRMFPAVAIAIPMLIILARMGFYDQEIPFGLALVYSVGAIGLTIWITGSIFLGIPVALEEAVQVFGGSRLQAFLRVTLPLAFPGLAASAMYAFLGAWNEMVAAIILTEFNPTFAAVVYKTLIGTTGQVNLAAASGMAMAIPAVIFTFFIRKYINQMWGGVTV